MNQHNEDMMEQGSPEWVSARLGRVTASRISAVMAKGDGITREKYMWELISEKLTGKPADGFSSADTERGNALEEEARRLYDLWRKGDDVKECGFFVHPVIDGAGASPDRLVGEYGLLEIKCPLPHNHAKFLKTGKIDAKYLKQMQFQMACTGRLWCDFVSYCPALGAGLEIKTIRIERDDEMISAINAEVRQFISDMETEMASLHNTEPKGKTNDRTKSFDI